MKKTSIFLTSALIVMAILAGCSDTVAITGLPQNVKSGTINQIGDFLTGQTFDPKKFTVDITYDNGQVITDDGSVTVQLDGTGNTVEKGAKVTALLGGNVYGEDVYATGSVAVYDINRIEVTGPASYAKDAVIPETDLTVTAYYYDSEKTEKTMPLATSEFRIVEESTKYANGKGTTPSIPEVAATIKVQSKLDNNVVEGTFAYTETYADTVDLPYEIESIEGISYTGQLLALNYDEVPVPALEDVAVTVNGDDGDTHDITAADLEGATAQFVDSETHLPLVLTDLVGNTEEEYAVELTWGDVVKYSPATYVTAKEVKLNVVAKPSFALTEGNELGTANADNFTIYYTVGEGTVATVLDADDFTINYVGSDGKTVLAPESIVVKKESPADGEVSVVYALVEYMGASKTSSGPIPVTAVEVVPDSITAVNFVDTFEDPAKQYYSAVADITPVVEDVVESYVVVYSDGTEVSSTSTGFTGSIAIEAKYYLDAEGENELSTAESVEPTDDGFVAAYSLDGKTAYYDVLADASQVYVKATYTPTEGEAVVAYVAVPLTEAVATGIDAITEYQYVNDSDEPMIDSKVEVTVRLTNGAGVVDPDYTDYGILDSDGHEVSSLPTVVENTEDLEFTVYEYLEGAEKNPVEDTVTILAGNGYVKVTKFAMDLAEDVIQLIDAPISTTVTDYALTGWTSEIGVEGEDAAIKPEFTIVVPSTQTVDANNTARAEITYLNNEGKAITTSLTFTFKGTAYTETITGLSYDGHDEIAEAEMYVGETYYANRFDIEGTVHGNDTNLNVLGFTTEDIDSYDPKPAEGEAIKLSASVKPTADDVTNSVAWTAVISYTTSDGMCSVKQKRRKIS